jgi:UDP-N-acetyl-D-mannosaminuronate dehydrogenase
MQETTMSPPIALIGLGYVGLPLAVEFGKRPWQSLPVDQAS